MAIVATRRKRLGAYYTDGAVAQFLTDWAIRPSTSRVLEPCFGEGAFLKAAVRRLQALGGQAEVVGVDLDAQAWQTAQVAFPDLQLHLADFFSLTPRDLGRFDAVVGNPPFIRYHHFTGPTRRRALGCAASAGAALPALASAWAPFLVHAASHLRSGGRLAMVAPVELTYARYARPVITFLARSFLDIHCLLFEDPLFPGLNESTMLLLCDDFGGHTTHVTVHRFGSAAELTLPLPSSGTSVGAEEWSKGSARARALDLLPECRHLYETLLERDEVARLGELANVGIGYVTGDNEYFHLTAEGVRERGLQWQDVLMAMRRSSDLAIAGLAFTESDLLALTDRGPHWLFYPRGWLDAAARAYVRAGEASGVSQRYKCRTRQPWFRIPGVRIPEMMLTVFASGGPQLVVNEARATASNSILLVDRMPDSGVELRRCAAAAVTTLAQLSAEIEGHALGGGALKLEPGEAKRWALPCRANVGAGDVDRLDDLVREGRHGDATDLADDAFLRAGLGLDRSQLALLRDGLAELRRLRKRSSRADRA